LKASLPKFKAQKRIRRKVRRCNDSVDKTKDAHKEEEMSKKEFKYYKNKMNFNGMYEHPITHSAY